MDTSIYGRVLPEDKHSKISDLIWKALDDEGITLTNEAELEIRNMMRRKLMSAISTDGMDKWLDDAYPDLDRRKANMIYEIASLIKDDPDTAPVDRGTGRDNV